MHQNRVTSVCGNILIGFLVSALAVLLSAIAFGGHMLLSLFAGAVFVTAATALLRSQHKASRRCRSILAAVGYVPMIILLQHEPINLYNRLFAIINPVYVREYGGPWIGDAFGLVFLWLPGAFILTLLSILLARKISKT